jgi:general stress protein YciG
VGNKKSRRGFAAIDPDRLREIAGRGGRAAHANGRAHEFTTEEARAAGRKGGKVPKARARAARVAEAAARLVKASPRGRGRRSPATLARWAEMARLWAKGLTLAEIGERYGITRQAVQLALRAVERAAAVGAEG